MYQDPRGGGGAKRPKLEFNRLGQSLASAGGFSGGASAAPTPAFKLPTPSTVMRPGASPAPAMPSGGAGLLQQLKEEKPRGVRWDEQGRLVDAEGNLVSLKVSLNVINLHFVIIERERA